MKRALITLALVAGTTFLAAPTTADTLQPVTATAPTFTDPTCNNNVQDYAVPTIEGIEWQRAEPREDIWPKIGLIAVAKDGYEVVGQDTFWHTYPALKTDSECNPPAKHHKPAPISGNVGAQLPATGA